DLLVVVRTPPAVAAARLASRASRHSRSQQLSPEDLLAELQRGDQLLGRLVGWWAGHTGQDRVIEVDGGTMTPAQARTLAARVVACAHRAAHPRPQPGADAPAVLHVCTRYQRGGSERRIRDLVAALPEMRHHLLLGRDSDIALAREQTSAHEVSVLPSLVRHVSPWQDLATVLRLSHRLRRGEYAVVVTHQSKAGALGRLAALAAGGPGVVHSLSMGSFGAGYGGFENIVFRRLERVLGGRTAAFCVVGSDLAQRFAEAGVPADRLHVVRSGVPLPAGVAPREETRRAVRERYGIPEEAPLLCYVGSLEPRKNVLLLAVVLYELSSRLPQRPHLLVVGEGPQRAELEGRVRALGLERQAVFTGHLAEPERVREAVRGSDLMLLLSKTEGLPQVLVQSAAEGTPFVSFDVEGVQELLALGARGTAVALGDLTGVVLAASRHLAQDSPADHEPVADLASWSPDAIRAAYRRVFHDVLGVRPVAAAVPLPRRGADYGAGRTSATNALAGRRPAAGALSTASPSTASA
ncbi:MAG TPA: glycosyltransferase, partial [Actinomycetes bacterium]|nr:glycosyltransferase [Actinomycetes bacterium]